MLSLLGCVVGAVVDRQRDTSRLDLFRLYQRALAAGQAKARRAGEGHDGRRGADIANFQVVNRQRMDIRFNKVPFIFDDINLSLISESILCISLCNF